MCGMKYSEVLSHRLEVVYTHVFMPSLKLCRVEKKGRKKKGNKIESFTRANGNSKTEKKKRKDDLYT